jgi:hypothetical protein
VIAQTDRNRRRLLSDLHCPVGTFQNSRRTVINPRVVWVISHADKSALLIGPGNRGQTGQDCTNQTVVLHGRHVVVDLEGGHIALRIQTNLNVRERRR